ncbi:MAG: glycosyltransferase family 2 protein, partial [Thermoflexales bacterium]|nr:glycosyltransferase family 2 protein [Thermoflexales bacterium]
MMPVVSIIIPAYNQAHYLAYALRSVLAQTLTEWEAIVVDDGSTDNTRDVAASFNDARIRYIFQANQGLSGARNTGVRAAQGEFLACLDSDDELTPEFLQTCVGALKADRALGAVQTATVFIDQAGNVLPHGDAQPLAGEAFQQKLRQGGFFPPVSVVARIDCVREAGLFDTTLTSLEDWDVWLRIAQRHPMRGLPQPLVRYRVYPGSMSTNAPRMLANRLAVIAKHVGAASGDPAAWSAEKREMYGYAYRVSALEHLQQHQTEATWSLLNQAMITWPPLLDQLDTYYELACGDQGKGFRGEAALLDVEANGRALLTWLNDLFLQVAALSAHRRIAYSQAYLALAMLSDQAGRWPLARHYLWQAIRSKPRLLASPSIVRRLLKLLAGQRVRRLARSSVKGSN